VTLEHATKFSFAAFAQASGCHKVTGQYLFLSEGHEILKLCTSQMKH
jgi:hypothetical protein